MTLSLERSPTKAKEAPSPNEVRLATLDTNPDFNISGNIQLLNLLKFTAVKNDFKKNLLVNNRLVKILTDTLAKMPLCGEQQKSLSNNVAGLQVIYRIPLGNCLFHAQVGEYQPAQTRSFLTDAFQTICARTRSSDSKVLI